MPPDEWVRHLVDGAGRVAIERCYGCDFNAVVLAPITTARVTAGSSNALVQEDGTFVRLQLEDGSAASISYLANGHKQVPKERVEAYWGGKVAVIDNYRSTRGYGVSVRTPGSSIFAAQDKGHNALVSRFMDTVRDASLPDSIPLDELFEVARWTLRIADAARTGGGEIAHA
jgi:hypothetical protein